MDFILQKIMKDIVCYSGAVSRGNENYIFLAREDSMKEGKEKEEIAVYEVIEGMVCSVGPDVREEVTNKVRDCILEMVGIDLSE